MRIQTSFAHVDKAARARLAALIEELAGRLDRRLTHFRPGLARLSARVERAPRGERWRASLRLQLPSGLLATDEETHDAEAAVRAVFDELERRLDKHLARLRKDAEWRRPARRARLAAPLPAAADEVERRRRAIYFDLIEGHLERVYNQVRRELTYLECSGTVPIGRLSVSALVDAAVLKGLQAFEERGDEFDIGDWLLRLAYETIEEEARAVRRAIPEGAWSMEAPPPAPAEDPTESDQEMYEFYQPDDLLLLEDIVPDASEEDAETESTARELALSLHRALADLPALWRRAAYFVFAEGATPARAAAVLGVDEAEAKAAAEHAAAFLRRRLAEAGFEHGDADLAAAMAGALLPMPAEDRDRLAEALAPGGRGAAA